MKGKALGINSAIQSVEFWHLALRLERKEKTRRKATIIVTFYFMKRRLKIPERKKLDTPLPCN